VEQKTAKSHARMPSCTEDHFPEKSKKNMPPTKMIITIIRIITENKVCDQEKFAILTNLLIRICLSQITTFMNFKACKPTDTVTRLLCHKDLSEDRYLTKKQKQKKNIHFRTIELEELKCELVH